MAAEAWRCSQCGTVNEAGARACSNCGKWPSLFDLQDSVEEAPERVEQPPFEVEALEPQVFEPETFEPVPAGTDAPEQVEVEDEAQEPRSRFPRWAITAIWILGILVWILANAFGDPG